VARLMPNATATTSGLLPSWTLATPRLRNSVSIAWFSLLASIVFVFMNAKIANDHINTTIPAEEAFQPLSKSKCDLIKK
jgi:hypothetical protein